MFSIVTLNNGIISAANGVTLEQIAKLWKNTPTGTACILNVYELSPDGDDAFELIPSSDSESFYLSDAVDNEIDYTIPFSAIEEAN